MSRTREEIRNIKGSELTYPDWVIIIFQILVYIFGAIPLRLRYRASRSVPGNIRLLRRGSLIMANHQSMVDPFYIVCNLPLMAYLRILPMRLPTADHIFNNPKFNPKFFPMLKLLGCFSIGKTSDELMMRIFYMRDLLRKRRTIVLFPEGAIVSEKTIGEFKKGVDFFLNDCVNVMFVRIRGFNEKRKFLYRKGEHSITFGRVLEPPPVMSTKEMRDYLERM